MPYMVYMPYMKQNMENRDPSPALTRGLELLRRLSQDGDKTLEKLAGETEWPKSSVLRLLTSLERFGAVERDPVNRRYRARMQLMDARSEGDSEVRLRAAQCMKRLCRETGHTVELFVFSGGQWTMIDRCEPGEREVFVRARIGWQPNANEATGLTQALLAFASEEKKVWPQGKIWYWKNNLEVPLSRKALREMIKEVHARGVAVSPYCNPSGVRRYVFPVHDRNDGLWGAVSIAATPQLNKQFGHKQLLRSATDAAKQLRRNITSTATKSVEPVPAK